MNKIVGIGACVMDTLITLPNFPKEDTKLRATSTVTAGGGPVGTGLVTVSKLGEKASYIGVLSDDNGGKFLVKDFEKYGVGVNDISIMPNFQSFTSVVWLNEQKGTRTCVFDKGNLPALVLNESQKEAIANADLLMVDGNEMDAAVEAAKADPQINKFLEGKNIVKVIFVKGKILNFVVK